MSFITLPVIANINAWWKAHIHLSDEPADFLHENPVEKPQRITNKYACICIHRNL